MYLNIEINELGNIVLGVSKVKTRPLLGVLELTCSERSRQLKWHF